MGDAVGDTVGVGVAVGDAVAVGVAEEVAVAVEAGDPEGVAESLLVVVGTRVCTPTIRFLMDVL
ncbi:MAG: hypothetical protein UW20_C0005G0039 [Candidatus Woesebacteria bacterium GW2011_GWB1_44_11]|uniref:Uncharacterized protein n=1 Tax=Candidatus Woesebacteria bacterium GW2011_GWB1_44_11 TaxID=1618579 RepID=A0A837I539_9BACT|nr:MAG: hypothetical protein UW20_C0005G0039 [Candidatus Woesebacteria bacterium GW2011_GWB1_44_11]